MIFLFFFLSEATGRSRSSHKNTQLHYRQGKIPNDKLYHKIENRFTLKVLLKRKWASLMAQLVKNPPALQETWVWSLGWEDLQKNGMATHSSILAWRIPLNRGAWRATVHGVQESDTTERLTHLCVMYIVARSSVWICIISSQFSAFLLEGLWKWCRGLLCAFCQEAHLVGMSVPWLATWAVITWGGSYKSLL